MSATLDEPYLQVNEGGKVGAVYMCCQPLPTVRYVTRTTRWLGSITFNPLHINPFALH